MKDGVLVPIDKAGRLVLPKEVRDELAIQPGDVLKVSIQGDEVTLRPNKERSGFVRKGRALVFSSGGSDLLTNETVDSLLSAHRESVTNDLSRGLARKNR
jgi:AbrB family looped-hinge helix DNA binding protein